MGTRRREQSHLLGFEGQFREGKGGHCRVRDEREQSARVGKWEGWAGEEGSSVPWVQMGALRELEVTWEGGCRPPREPMSAGFSGGLLRI